jgi:ubiquinol-cytochrome c reductase cytochrome b subunit
MLGDYNINSFVWLSRVLTTYYFVYFWVIMRVVGWTEKTLPVPDSISKPVLPEGSAVAAAE